MGDITKIREWVDTDDPEPEDGWDWPHPPVCIESEASGELRARILAKAGRPGDAGQVRLIEREVEGGWSEYTPETDYSIEVMVGDQKVWSQDLECSAESAMGKFMSWLGAGGDMSEVQAFIRYGDGREVMIGAPLLGLATTRELLDELRARIEVDGKLDYRTVDSECDQSHTRPSRTDLSDASG